jgi:UDP-N-acetylglucosamine 4,6-dehydratase
MAATISGSWLITGGTGSFGHAFTERLLEGGADRVAIFSRDELKQAEMRQRFSDPRLRFMIGSVADRERVELAVRGVDYVVHAAAMKRIETCEQNPWEAVQTNVVGTREVAMAAIGSGVSKAVFLSTDKAAAPNTLYGATKLTAERLWTQSNVYAAGLETLLAATRYGNVIGSRGSVVPLFRKQAEAGEVTITDPSMTRFWMRLSDAVDLVQLAFSEMRGGEVFVPKIPSASVATVADATVGETVRRRVVGARPGEKLHETLISEDEAATAYEYGDHYRIEPDRSWGDLPLSAPGCVFAGSPTYRSDTNPQQLDADGFREMIACTSEA